jgi:hypothetical protein
MRVGILPIPADLVTRNLRGPPFPVPRASSSLPPGLPGALPENAPVVRIS